MKIEEISFLCSAKLKNNTEKEELKAKKEITESLLKSHIGKTLLKKGYELEEVDYDDVDEGRIIYRLVFMKEN